MRWSLARCPERIKAQCYYIKPMMEYASPVCDVTRTYTDPLEAVQRSAARFMKGNYRITSSSSHMLTELTSCAGNQ